MLIQEHVVRCSDDALLPDYRCGLGSGCTMYLFVRDPAPFKIAANYEKVRSATSA